jgi:hypothetical protein
MDEGKKVFEEAIRAQPFGAIELLGDQLPIPSEDGVGLGDAGDLREYFTP